MFHAYLVEQKSIIFCGKLKSGVDLLFLRIYNILQYEYELFNLILHYILVKFAFLLEWKISFTFPSFFFYQPLSIYVWRNEAFVRENPINSIPASN